MLTHHVQHKDLTGNMEQHLTRGQPISETRGCIMTHTVNTQLQDVDQMFHTL